MNEIPAKTEICINCTNRFSMIEQLEMEYMEEEKRIDQTIISEIQRKRASLTQKHFEKRGEIENNLSVICMRSGGMMVQGGTRQYPKDYCQQELAQKLSMIKQLEMEYMEEEKRIDQTIISEIQRKRASLTQKHFEKRGEIENNLSVICMRSGGMMVQGGTRQYPKDCQQELAQKNKIIKELEEANMKTRSELEELKKKHQVFRERMSVEASVEIGTSGELFEDISNPCRESELRASYNKMKITMWPKCIKEIEQKVKSSRRTVDKKEENDKARRMIKEVFAKAADDMMEKKKALESFFKISDKTTPNKKRLQCFEMAVQSLQLMILWEECTRYQDMYKQLGHSTPDYLCQLADQVYKQGCLMELHNPPLTLDWDNHDSACPFPDVTTKSVPTNDLMSDEV